MKLALLLFCGVFLWLSQADLAPAPVPVLAAR